MGQQNENSVQLAIEDVLGLEQERLDREADARIARLRAELFAVQSAREEMRQALLVAQRTGPTVKKSSARPWVFLATAASAVALALCFTLGPAPPNPDTLIVETAAPIQPTGPAVRVIPPESVAPVVKNDAAASPPLVKKPKTRGRGSRGQKKPVVENGKGLDWIDTVNNCPDDPLCGMEPNKVLGR
jgi:hypothetical protein